VPEIVQDRHRNPAINDGCAKLSTERGRGPVFPRTRKERELVAMRGGVRLHEPTDVLADTRARAQGWAVVDENPH
jgi:hypothetical protein